MDQVRALENWQGKRHAVVNLFTNWSSQTKVRNNLFNQQLLNVWNNGNVPMITWEPYTGTNTPADIVVRIAHGDYDTYVNSWSARLKIFLIGPDGIYGNADDRRAYLRFAHEMNGDWYPWGAASGGSSPQDYVSMWKHVKDIFDSKGLDTSHLQWVWCVNSEDIGVDDAEEFFPGDEYVNWIAIDGYNWGASQTWSSWRLPMDIYENMRFRLSDYQKPFALTEFASTSRTPMGTSVQQKLDWITALFSYTKDMDIRLVCWFNEDKETDWIVFGGNYGDGTFKYGRTTYKTYSTYKLMVNEVNSYGDNYLLSSNPLLPRLLTDEQFTGSWPY